MSTTNSNNSSWPLTGITRPGDNDVVCGRGGASIHHPGNITYRNMARAHQRKYIGFDDTRHMKTLLSHQLVKEWRKQSPPGRFLKKNEATGLWEDVGIKVARRKTAQLLREGAKKLRGEMRANGEISSSDSDDDSSCAPPSDRPAAQAVSPERPMAFMEYAAANGLGLENVVSPSPSLDSRIVPSLPPALSVPLPPMNAPRDPFEGLSWGIEMEQLSRDLRACVRDGRDMLYMNGQPKSSLEVLEVILEPIMPTSQIA